VYVPVCMCMCVCEREKELHFVITKTPMFEKIGISQTSRSGTGVSTLEIPSIHQKFKGLRLKEIS
jgi:hypothetical protein